MTEHTTAEPSSGRFLGAFNRIDAALARLAMPDRPQGFADRTRLAAQRSEIVAEHQEELRLLGRLRNAIAHESRDSQPIAEPHGRTVMAATRLAELLEHPPVLVDVLDQGMVVTCRDSDAIGPIIQRMHEADFSQVPVLSSSDSMRLMTAETILHWIAENGAVPDLQTAVSSVMDHSDSCDAAAFLPAESNVGDALRVFRAADLDERRYWAVIVTRTGTDREEPLAIATTSDIVKLHRAVQI